MRNVIRSKFFWILAAILIPFVVIWLTASFAMAILVGGAVAVLVTFIRASGNERRRRIYDD